MNALTLLSMDAVRSKYLRNLASQRQDILRLSSACANGPADSEDLARLSAFAHKLAGTGKIYGFPEISEAGYALENALRNEENTPAEIVRQTRYLLNVMERAIRSAKGRRARAEPVEDREESRVRYSATADTTAVSGRPVVLVIDDDEGITDLVHSLFGEVATVISRPDVPGGLAAAMEINPHLILLDEQMPDASGLDLLEQLRELPATSNVPIIMMSANDSLTSIMQALVSGATDYVIKPFEPTTLLTRSMELLKTYRTRILIVDDDEAIRELLTFRLANAGCQVFAVGDCDEAWERLEEEDFSLVLLDRMMPDADGAALLRRMQGWDGTARIPVIFLTARRSAADIVDGLLTGATDYITKPFNPDDVVKRCLDLVKAKKH